MDELSVKIKIHDRIYPMKVAPADEAFVREAGKELQCRLSAYKKELGINDPQDLLAMVGFDCLVAKIRMEEKIVKKEEQYAAKLDGLTVQIDKAI